MYTTLTDKINYTLKKSSWSTLLIYALCFYPLFVFSTVRVFNSIQYLYSCEIFIRIVTVLYWGIVFYSCFCKYKNEKIKNLFDTILKFLKEEKNKKVSFDVLMKIFNLSEDDLKKLASKYPKEFVIVYRKKSDPSCKLYTFFTRKFFLELKLNENYYDE